MPSSSLAVNVVRPSSNGVESAVKRKFCDGDALSTCNQNFIEDPAKRLCCGLSDGDGQMSGIQNLPTYFPLKPKTAELPGPLGSSVSGTSTDTDTVDAMEIEEYPRITCDTPVGQANVPNAHYVPSRLKPLSGLSGGASGLCPRHYCRLSWDPSLDSFPYVSDIY